MIGVTHHFAPLCCVSHLRAVSLLAWASLARLATNARAPGAHSAPSSSYCGCDCDYYARLVIVARADASCIWRRSGGIFGRPIDSALVAGRRERVAVVTVIIVSRGSSCVGPRAGEFESNCKLLH